MRIKNLNFAYKDKIIFDNFNLECDNKIICIMGESGKGKTTLLKLIAGLIKPDSGSIETSFINPSIMFQEDRLLRWFNVLDNVMLVSEDKNKAVKLLNELDIDYNLEIDKLSGGMARRVCLVRTLLYESDALLLDEPFKGMDDKLIDKVAKIIIRENKPVIITSHNLKEAEIIDAKIIRI